MSPLNAVIVRDENQLDRMADHFKLINRMHAAEFVRTAQERYENYVSQVHFSYMGEMIPYVLNLVVFEVESYGQNSPLYDAAVDSAAEELHEENPTDFPDPYGEDWEDEHSIKVADFVADCWENVQADLVHDLEIVFLALGFSFVIPDEIGEYRVINNPIVEVW